MSCEGGTGKQINRPIIPSPLFYEVPKNDKSVSSGMATLDIKAQIVVLKRKQKERKNFKERKRRVATAEKFSELSRLTKEIMAGKL